jgi:hypothetical protein
MKKIQKFIFLLYKKSILNEKLELKINEWMFDKILGKL